MKFYKEVTVIKNNVINKYIGLSILVFFLIGCTPSESKVQTAVAESLKTTQAFKTEIDLAISQTQAAIPSSTMTLTPSPTITQTSTCTPVPTRPGLVVDWEFSEDGDTGGWGANSWDIGGIESIKVKDGFLIAESVSNDPMLYVRNLRLDANRIIEIQIRMKVSDGTDAKLYFVTEEKTDMNETKAFPFSIQPGEEFFTYTINTLFNTQWVGIITELRIDPTNAPAMIEIDHIRMLTESE